MTRFHSSSFLLAAALGLGLISMTPLAISTGSSRADLTEPSAMTQTYLLAHAQPSTLLTATGRFLLTDLWITRDENNEPILSGTDRVWLERSGKNVREVLFDVFIRDLPNPLHFETGLVVEEGDVLRMQYSFAVAGQNRATRRVLLSGTMAPSTEEN